MPYTTRAQAREAKASRVPGPPSQFPPSDNTSPAAGRRDKGPVTRKTVTRAVAPVAGSGAVDGTPDLIRATCHGFLPQAGATIGAGIACIIIAGFAAHKRAARTETRYLRTGALAAGWVIIDMLAGPWFTGLPLVLWNFVPPAGALYASIGGWVHDSRRKPAQAAPEPVAAIEAPPVPEPEPEPEEVTKFREVMKLGSSQFGDIIITGFQRLGTDGEDGFSITGTIPATTRGGVSSLQAAQYTEMLAKTYRTIPRLIQIEYDRDGDRPPSEAHFKLTVEAWRIRTAWTAKRLDPRISTFDPSTGAFEILDFADATPGHWQITDPPKGGATGGVISGRPGSGKSGAANVVLTQSGLACLGGRRICHLLVGDPQYTALPVWRGRATIYGSGPKATLQVLRVAAAITNNRARHAALRTRVDALGRPSTGQGWWALTPDFPLVGVLIDEVPIITGAEVTEEERAEAVGLMSLITRKARKTGVWLIPITQTPDLQMLGHAREIRENLKAWNILNFSADMSSSGMLGFQTGTDGFGQKGQCLLKSIDDRPTATGYIRWLEEDDAEANAARQRNGEELLPDCRDVADLILSMDIAMDDAFAEAAGSLGYPGGNWVITDADFADVTGDDAKAGDDITPPASRLIAATGKDVDAAVAGMAPVQEVIDVLLDRGEPADMYALAAETGLSVGHVTTAIAVLALDGKIEDTGDGRWAVRAQAAA